MAARTSTAKTADAKTTDAGTDAPAGKSITLRFTHLDPTKGTFKLEEQTADYDRVGRLYVKKVTAAELPGLADGDLEVTLRVVPRQG